MGVMPSVTLYPCCFLHELRGRRDEGIDLSLCKFAGFRLSTSSRLWCKLSDPERLFKVGVDLLEILYELACLDSFVPVHCDAVDFWLLLHEILEPVLRDWIACHGGADDGFSIRGHHIPVLQRTLDGDVGLLGVVWFVVAENKFMAATLWRSRL